MEPHQRNASACAAGWRRASLAATALLLGACPREAEPATCPDLGEGALVVTEIRGAQEGVDTYGQWIELFNTTDGDVDLLGLRLTLTPISGEDPAILAVRREGVVVPAGGYVVIGKHDDRNLPDHVDYGYRRDYDRDLFEAALVEVAACDTVLDTMLYRALPALGTLALDGAIEPTAQANDDQDALCIDAADAPPGPQTESGLPGTPGEPNPRSAWIRRFLPKNRLGDTTCVL